MNKLMRSCKSLSRSSGGFSLIEMMVVVAIIGVMATIAVPNYTMMMDRAHQSEAKAELNAIFATENLFHQEFKYYTYCLYENGYLPQNPQRYYFTGFANGRSCGSGQECTYDATGTNCSFSSVAWSGASRNSASFEMNRWANPNLRGWGVSGPYDVWVGGFKAVAFGSINGRSQIMDVWSVDNTQTLKNEQPGL